MEDNIKIEIKGERESAQEFVKAWRRAEQGQAVSIVRKARAATERLAAGYGCP